MSALDLARELVALPGWEWLDGMRALDGDQRCGYRLTENSCLPGHPAPVVDDSWLPDLDDPATLGALLGLVRERLGEPMAHLSLTSTWDRDGLGGTMRVPWWVVQTTPRGYGMSVGDGPTEAEALVVALRAAGVRS